MREKVSQKQIYTGNSIKSNDCLITLPVRMRTSRPLASARVSSRQFHSHLAIFTLPSGFQEECQRIFLTFTQICNVCMCVCVFVNVDLTKLFPHFYLVSHDSTLASVNSRPLGSTAALLRGFLMGYTYSPTLMSSLMYSSDSVVNQRL